jgi:hypothetical protein
MAGEIVTVGEAFSFAHRKRGFQPRVGKAFQLCSPEARFSAASRQSFPALLTGSAVFSRAVLKKHPEPKLESFGSCERS